MEAKDCEKCGAPLTETETGYKCNNCGAVYEKSKKILDYQIKNKRLDEEKRKNQVQEKWVEEDRQRKEDRREGCITVILVVILLIVSVVVYVINGVQSLFKSIFG